MAAVTLKRLGGNVIVGSCTSVPGFLSEKLWFSIRVTEVRPLCSPCLEVFIKQFKHTVYFTYKDPVVN